MILINSVNDGTIAQSYAKIQEPGFYHRQYTHDVEKPKESKTFFDLCKRVGLVALPFIGLCENCSKPLSLATDGLRGLSSLTTLINGIHKADASQIASGMLNTAISVASIAGTIFANPLGMLVTTGHDIALNTAHLYCVLQEKDYKKAAEITAQAVGSLLYLGLFFSGSLHLSILAVSVQILLGLYRSGDDLKKGNYLEAGGHVLMATIKANQLRSQIAPLQLKDRINQMVSKIVATTRHMFQKNLIGPIAIIGVTPFCISSLNAGHASSKQSLDASEELSLNIDNKLPELKSHRTFQYPNEGCETLASDFPNGKVVVFGYGSLMNKSSLGGFNNAAGRPTVKQEAVDSVRPVVAFGIKRLFNYQDRKRSNFNRPSSEKAYLNLEYSSNIHSMTNGVAFEVDQEDLANLVSREIGYDLVPILLASWNGVMTNNPDTHIQIGYTFMASREPRNGIVYTNDEIYPIRGYVHGVEQAASSYGDPFLEFWRNTTYLGDGQTKIHEWNSNRVRN